jgi:hypothetical protein
MSFHFRKIFAITLFILLLPNLVKAQRKGEFINAAIGRGISVPNDNSDPLGAGFYAQGEYVLGVTKWVAIRPYAGVILTSPKNDVDQQNQAEYKVTSKAFLLGGKVRIVAPIPYIAPYFEIGIGASIGSFQTYTPFTNINKSGVITHIPFSIGLALGRKHSVEIAFIYYSHPAAHQYSGAAAAGFTFPL